jgi:hypothetical protein
MNTDKFCCSQVKPQEIIMLKYLKWIGTTFLFLFFIKSFGGVTNPDISAIGQVIGKYTSDSASGLAKKPTLELGEVELMLVAALNPYVNGAFVFSLNQDAIEIEEAYASVIRGLPWNIGLKTGKYRLGFGRLNPAHPHAYPFISTPRIIDPGIAKLLPGSESFNDIAVQASSLLPVGDNYSLLISGDILQGNSFHPDTTVNTAQFGWLARIDNSFLIGENIPTSIGFSLTRGTSNPAENTKDLVVGIDVKTKLTLSPTIVMTVQGEYIYKYSDYADSLHVVFSDHRGGFYGFVDAHFQNHYNAGILYEQYQSSDNTGKIDRGVKPFVGFNLLEESTILRVAYEYFKPHRGEATNSVELQFLYSMGPHKAHLF